MKKLLVSLFAVFALLALPFQAMAITITPQYTTFGALPAATFGGSGIPNNAVAITNYTQQGGGTLTLGLTAHQRYSNPAVTNNGAGTFFAQAGNDSANGQPNYAIWNFGFYVSGVQTGQTTMLYFDTDPSVGNNVSANIPFGGANGQDSWNLGMVHLGGVAYPEMAAGEYSFALVTYNSAGTEIARSAMIVNVGGESVPEGGATIAMLGMGLFSLGLMHYRRPRQSHSPALQAA